MKWSIRGASGTTVLVLFLAGLYYLSTRNYLLFHSLAETVAVIIAFLVFALAWNTRRFLENQYLLFLGLIYPFVGALDFLHTLAYSGMGIFQDHMGANLATQFWIQARYLEGISFLIAPVFLFRRVRIGVVLALYSAVTVFFVLSIHPLGIFPSCYIEGSGLTPFKIVSEYIICFILAAGLTFVIRNREQFHGLMHRYVSMSIAFTIASELSLTLYLNVYGPVNMAGHLLKVLSFYLIYKGIIEAGLTEPYGVMFRNLKNREEELGRAREKLLTANEELENSNEELRESRSELEFLNADLENIFNNVGVATVIVDRDLKVRRSNNLAGLIFDFTKGDRGRKITSVLTHFEIPDLQEDLLEVIRSGKQSDRIVGGTTRQFNLGILPYLTGDESVDGAILVFVDITATLEKEKQLKKQNEELTIIKDRLDRSEKHLLDLFHRAPLCYMILDPEGLITDVNATCKTILGLRGKEMLGRSIMDLMPENSGEEFLAQMQKAKANQPVGSFALSLTVADGNLLRFAAEFTADRDATGDVRSFRLALLDVTELQILQRERERAETLFETVFSASKDGFIIGTAEDARYVQVNKGYLDMVGFTREELVGKSAKEVGVLVDEKERAELIKAVRKEGSDAREMKLRRKDGQIIDCLVVTQRIVLDDRELLLVVVRDITEKKRLRKSLEEVNRELKQRNADLEGFIYTAAHDLRSPLISTIGFFVLLKKTLKEKVDPNIEELIDRISQQLHRYDQLLRDLLDLAQVGVEEVHRGKVDVAKVVLSIKEERECLEKGSGEVIRIQEDMPRVHMGESRVLQIFDNLLSNSFRYRREDIPLAIEVGTKAETGDRPVPEGHGTFFIRDNGIGINPKDHDSIFTLFSQSSGSEENEGTGVGLTIVKRIIVTEGGWIRVESEPGKGATFLFTLPLVEDENS